MVIKVALPLGALLEAHLVVLPGARLVAHPVEAMVVGMGLVAHGEEDRDLEAGLAKAVTQLNHPHQIPPCYDRSVS